MCRKHSDHGSPQGLRGRPAFRPPPTDAALTLARELQIRRDTERREQELAQGRRVLVTRPRQLPPTRTLEVPAAIRAWSETPVYAKVCKSKSRVKAIQVNVAHHRATCTS